LTRSGAWRPLHAGSSIRCRFRLPIACLLIVGSFLSILPVFGLWMLPLGLMLLALDVPLLRPWVSNLLIRARRRIDVWRHRGATE
jgi:hypothetical protein